MKKGFILRNEGLLGLAVLIAVFYLGASLGYADKPPADEDKVITPTSTPPPLELMYPKSPDGGFSILSVSPGWTEKTPASSPGVRNNHEMVWDNSNGILFGGWLSGSYNYNDTWWYSPVSNTWTNKNPSNPPPGKSCTAMVWDGANCILFGGSNTGTRSNDTWWYSPVSNTWTNKNPSSPPAARFYHRMVWDGTRCIMFGGNTSSGYMNDLWWYNPSANTWTQKSPTGGPPAARGQCGMIWDGTRVVMFGGYGTGGAYNDVWWYDPSANTWTQKIAQGASGSPVARWTHTLTWSLNRAVLFGGYDTSTYRNDVWWYNPTDNTWFQKIANNPNDTPTQRGGQTMIWDNTRDIMFAGYDTAFRNDLWWYDPDSSGPSGSITIDTAGSIGNAVGFSPTPNTFTTHIVVPHNSALDPANLTVSCWVKTSDTGNYRGIVTKGLVGGGWNMDVTGGALRFMVKSSGGTFYVATHSGTICNGNWHHVVGVFNSVTGVVSVYLDGVKGTDATGASKGATTNDMDIGGGSSSGAAYSLNGTIDEVKLYNRAWTTADVGYEYNSANGLYGHSTDPDIVCGYHLDETAGITADNFAGVSLDGTLTGSPTPTWVTGKVYKLNVNPTYITATPPAVVIYLAVSDPDTGLYKMRFRNTTDSWLDNWEPFSKTKSWTLASGDGSKTVEAQVSNLFGVVSEFPDSITYDTTGPTGDIVINGGATYPAITNVVITLNTVDTASNCAYMRFKNDSDPWLDNWETFTTTKNWVISDTPGTRYVWAEVKNYAGLTSTFWDTIILDTTPPTGEIYINNRDDYVTQTSVTVTLAVTDTDSGLTTMRLKNDNNPYPDTWDPFASPISWTLSGADLTCTVWAQVKNGAGAYSEFSDYILYDNTPPEGNIIIDGGAQYTSSTAVTITLNAYDPFPVSGLNQMRFSNNGSTWSNWENYAAAKPDWSLAWPNPDTEDGLKTVYAQVKNQAGLVNSPDFSDTITLDRVPPSAFNLLLPANEGLIFRDGAPVLFDWSASTDTMSNPVTYKLIMIDPTYAATQGGHSSAGKSVIGGIAGDSYSMSQPIKAGAQYWTAQASDAAGNSTYATGAVSTGNCHETHGPTTANWLNSTGASCGPDNDCGDPNGARTSLNPGIDYSSGNANMSFQITHIAPSTALESNVTLYYNSMGDTLGGYGTDQNWSHTFDQVLIPSAGPVISASATVTYRQADGRRVVYTETATADVYAPFDFYGDSSVLTDYNTAGYAVIYYPKRGITYTFAANNNDSVYELTKIEDRHGNAVTCTYTAADKVEFAYLPGGRTITFAYTDGKLTTITDPSSNQTTVNYNTDGKLYEIVQDSGNWKWSFTYYAGTNRISGATNPNNKTNSYQYGPDGKFYQVTDALGNISTVTVDTPTAVAAVSRAGEATTMKYDLALDTWKASTDALGNAATNVFDASRNLTKSTNPLGYYTEYVYNSRDNVTVITDTMGCVTQYFYQDSRPGNEDLPTYIIDARGVAVSMTYNAKGSLMARTDAYGTVNAVTTNYTYYVNGRLESQTTDPSGLSLFTSYEYNGNGYLSHKYVEVGNGLPGLDYYYDYDSLGRLTKSYDPRYGLYGGVFTEYQYDSRGNNTLIIGPVTDDPATSNVRTRMDYDYMDNIVNRIDDETRKNIIAWHQYNNVGWLTDVWVDYGGLGLHTHTDYYGTGRVWKVTAPTGALTEYTYYDNGRLHEVKQGLNETETAITEYQYDANGNTFWVKDPELHQTNYSYWPNDKVFTATDAANNTTTYYYDGCGCCQADRVIDARGYTTYTAYDELKRVKYIRTPQENITTAYEYDKGSRRTKVYGPWKDANANGIPDDADTALERAYGYDKPGRMTSSYALGQSPTVYGYDANSNVISTTDAVGVNIQYVYEKRNYLQMATVDPAGLNEQTSYVYDNLGRQTRLIRASNSPTLATHTSYDYDNAGRLTRQYDPMSPTYQTTYQYYNYGLEKWVIDANNNTTKYFYDKWGRLTRTTDARGYNTDYQYNRDSQQTKLTYVRGGNAVDTTYEYYNNHLLHIANYPGFTGTNTTTYSYDGNGNMLTKQDANNNSFSYQYDANNRLTTKTQSAQSWTYSYDAGSNLLTLVGPNTNLAYVYDYYGRLQSATDNILVKTVGYTYYQDNLRNTMLDPQGNLTVYSYDAAKRLKTVTVNGAQEAFYSYNALGQRTQAMRGQPGVAVTDYTYNHSQRWLTSLVNWAPPTPTTVSSFAYTYDLVGNKTSMGLLGGDVLAYGYDADYQLTSEVRTGIVTYTIGIQYDEVGNRLTQTKNGVATNYSYNNANQLLTEVTGITPTVYAYDANGNVVSKTALGWTYLYGYDSDNHMINYTDSQTPTNNATYTYDALGRRTQKLLVGYWEQYVYDGSNIVADYNVVVTATYVTPFLDENLLVTRYFPIQANYYYTHDGLGSVRNLLDSAGAVQNTYDYTGFGEALNWVENVVNRYTYTGREHDSESGLDDYRERKYSSSIGRFNRRDPIGYKGGINLYGYVVNNPINLTDPFGEKVKYNITFHAKPVNVTKTAKEITKIVNKDGKKGVYLGYCEYTASYPNFGGTYQRQPSSKNCQVDCWFNEIEFTATNQIYVAKDISQQDLEKVLRHELLHAAIYSFAWQDGKQELEEIDNKTRQKPIRVCVEGDGGRKNCGEAARQCKLKLWEILKGWYDKMMSKADKEQDWFEKADENYGISDQLK
ncbi:MAG: hypothetical protein HY762_02065 [Planctomycetes bacterium]|nr:hypothetical protein [Planctomycetota bacterium]